jgi:hypothetical protein
MREISVRADSDKAKLEELIGSLGQRVKGPGTIYLAGGATALLFGWRAKTIDVDSKADPEPRGLFEAIAELVLYALLKKEGRNAYGRSNFLIRELVSFVRALTHKTQAA